jgi:hypothetical protein
MLRHRPELQEQRQQTGDVDSGTVQSRGELSSVFVCCGGCRRGSIGSSLYSYKYFGEENSLPTQTTLAQSRLAWSFGSAGVKLAACRAASCFVLTSPLQQQSRINPSCETGCFLSAGTDHAIKILDAALQSGHETMGRLPGRLQAPN